MSLRQQPRRALCALLLALTVTACSGSRSRAHTRPGHVEKGLASWYGEPFHGRATASGEIYDMHGISAAHKTLPLGTRVEVLNLDNGRRLEVRINDRGPFIRGRIIDLSRGAAERLDMIRAGVVPVELRIVALPEVVGRFTVQAGAFREEGKARKLEQRLQRQGLSRVRVETHDGWFRVRVGAFDRRDTAQETARKLRRQGLEATVLGL